MTNSNEHLASLPPVYYLIAIEALTTPGLQLFEAKALNFVEVLSGFKRDHVVSADAVDGTGSRVLCLKIMDGVTFGSLICSNNSFFLVC